MLNKIVLSYNYMVTSFNIILAKISSSPGSLLEADIWNEKITPALSVLQFTYMMYLLLATTPPTVTQSGCDFNN